MTVVGFNITNVSVTVEKKPTGKFKVSPKLHIDDVSVQDFPMSKDGEQKVIATKFTSGFGYEGGSDITLSGIQLFLVPKKIAEEVNAEYEKSKKLPAAVLPKIMSAIFTRCQTKSIKLADEFGLPCPIPLPKLSVQKAEPKAK